MSECNDNCKVVNDIKSLSVDLLETVEQSSGGLETAQVSLEQIEQATKGDIAIESLKLLVAQAVEVIRNQRQANETIKLSVQTIVDKLTQENESLKIDKVTGLPKRDRLDDAFKKRMGLFKLNGLPFSVAVIDIDNFKSVNDTYNHQIGDRVLKHFADLLRKNFGPDEVFRWGGEEFVVVTGGSKQTLAQKVSYVLAILNREPFKNRDLELYYTFSAGVAESEEDDTPETMFNRADQMMLKIKKIGKNRVGHT